MSTKGCSRPDWPTCMLFTPFPEKPSLRGLAAGPHGRRHQGQLPQDGRRSRQGRLRRRRHNRLKLAGAEGVRRREVIDCRVRSFYWCTNSTLSKGYNKAWTTMNKVIASSFNLHSRNLQSIPCSFVAWMPLVLVQGDLASSLSKTSHWHWCESCVLVKGPYNKTQIQINVNRRFWSRTSCLVTLYNGATNLFVLIRQIGFS